jgi:hypothetical protein
MSRNRSGVLASPPMIGSLDVRSVLRSLRSDLDSQLLDDSTEGNPCLRPKLVGKVKDWTRASCSQTTRFRVQ